MGLPVGRVLIRSAELSGVAQYAYAATAPAEARLSFLTGACPLNLDGSTAGFGGYSAQASKALENLVIAREAAGARLDDDLSTRVPAASSNQSDLVKEGAVIRDAFGTHAVPSTFLGVTVSATQISSSRSTSRSRSRPSLPLSTDKAVPETVPFAGGSCLVNLVVGVLGVVVDSGTSNGFAVVK